MKRCMAMWAAMAVGMAVCATAQRSPPPVDIDAMKGFLAGALGDAAKAGPVVDFRDLKAMLPESLPGMKRTAGGGEKNSILGMTVSMADGTYQKEGAGTIQIKILDFGGAGVYSMAEMAWASAEIDRETQSGYEKTVTHKGCKGFERFNNQARNGEVHILVGGRYHVAVKGRSVDMRELKAALDTLDIAKLAALKPPAPSATPPGK